MAELTNPCSLQITNLKELGTNMSTGPIFSSRTAQEHKRGGELWGESNPWHSKGETIELIDLVCRPVSYGGSLQAIPDLVGIQMSFVLATKESIT